MAALFARPVYNSADSLKAGCTLPLPIKCPRSNRDHLGWFFGSSFPIPMPAYFAIICGCLMQSIHYSLTEEFEAGVVYLTSSQLWFEATVVRNTTSPRGNPNAHSPGLVMILQRTTNANEFEDTASDLARCLINNAIDRVCVIRGGSRALFSLPQITNYFVSPRT
ncbi:hypothetical protein Aperf_G00000056081 [Anoplocephala perfoliata]